MLFGSRGALFCLLVFLLFYYNLFFKYKLSQKSRSLIFWVSLSFFTIYLLLCLFINIFDLTLSLPRNIQTLLNPISLLTSDSSISRIRIYEKIVALIKDTPFIGFGPLADQYFLGASIFSHNLYLEFLITFGIFSGSILFFVYILFVVLTIKRYKSQQFFVCLFLLFFSLSFTRLLYSYSFWYDSNFWLSIGIGARIIFNKEENRTLFEVINV